MSSAHFVGAEFGQTLKLLWRAKGISPFIVVTFALGVAVNVVVFAIVRGVLLAPLSFPDSERVVITLNQYPRTSFGRVGSSVANYFERKEGIAAFDEVAAVRFNPVTLGTNESSERVAAGHVTASFFSLLAVKPKLGRYFDDQSPRDVVVISDDCWRQKFNGESSIIGREVRINGSLLTIIGVTPRDFRYPSYPSAQPQMWLPLQISESERSPARRHSTNVDVIARLRPGTTVTEAQKQLDALNHQLAAQDPERKWAEEAGFRVTVLPLREDAGMSVRSALWLLQGGALVLLFVAAANTLNLLLIRAVARTREFAVRRTLGASVTRLVLQITLETLVLSIVGGVAGLGCGAALLRAIAVFGINQLPRAEDITFQWPIALAALSGSIGCALAMAMPLIFCMTGANLSSALKAESYAGTASLPLARVRRGLIAVQVALAFVLIATTGLLGASLKRVLAVAPGFEPENVLTGVLTLSSETYEADQRRFAMIERLQTELRNLPGVQSVGVSSALPFASVGGSTFVVEGSSRRSNDSAGAHYLTLVGGNYFDALRIALREGRVFTLGDSFGAERVCIVDEAFAHTYWPGQSPLGYRVVQGTRRTSHDSGATIVGVVGTVHEGDPIKRPTQGTVYFPLTNESTGRFFYVSVKSAGSLSLPTDMRKVLSQIDPTLAWSDVRHFSARVDETLLARRSPLFVAAAFALVAFILSGVGVYGVIGFDVVRRRREIGIRVALGAQPAHIVRLFLSLGGRMWISGLALGATIMMILGHLLGDLLYGVSPDDAQILIATGAFLGVATILACLPQSLRASRMSPIAAINSQ